jgi:GNAT superfamily N-acetyltransferase
VQLPGECAPPAGAVLLAMTETQVAGCALLLPVEDGIAEVRRLFVRPALRGQGIGRALMQAAIDTAQKAGHHTLRLETLEAMHEAMALYRRLGFVEVPPWHPPHTDHDKTIFMSLRM